MIYETYTKRKRRAEQGESASFQYDVIPDALRHQVVFIWRDTLGVYREVSPYNLSPDPKANARWKFICESLLRERGAFTLTGRQANPHRQCVLLVLTGSTDDALEVIEFSFRFIELRMSKIPLHERRMEGLKQSPDDAIAELNARFREHGVGYRYENGQIVRIESELLHQETTVPAIVLLRKQGFDGPLQEFMSAHEHFRKGEIKDANVDALNAFESTLKAICGARKWEYPGGAAAGKLVEVVLDKGLVPRALQSQFENLVKTLTTGLPPIRNTMGGHGQGVTTRSVDEHLGAYALHLLGATIVLLIEAHRTLR